MLFVGTSIIHPSTEGVFLLCNILDLLIYSKKLKKQRFTLNLHQLMQKSVQARENRIISAMGGQFQSELPIF